MKKKIEETPIAIESFIPIKEVSEIKPVPKVQMMGLKLVTKSHGASFQT